MNSFKNVVVTAILLAVGYGAYVVLNNPPTSLDQQFEDEQWGTPIEKAEVAVKGAADNVKNAFASGLESVTSLAADDDWPSQEKTSDLHRAPPITPGNDAHDMSFASVDEYPKTENPSAYFAENDDANYEANDDDGSFYASQASNDAPPLLDAPAIDSAADARNTAVSDPASNYDNSYESSYNETASSGDYPEITEYPTTDLGPPENSNPQPGVAAASNDAFEATWFAVLEKLQQDRLDEALLDLSAWYGDDSLSPQQSKRCVEKLDQLAGTVIYSGRSYLEPAYQVRSGESLQLIAERLRVPVDFLAKINGISPPYLVNPGEYLKIVRGPFRAEVSRGRRELTMFLGQYYAGRFGVNFGRDLPNQDAVYEVAEKTLGRNFFDVRTGDEILRSDPANPYGGYWIGLRGDQVTAAHNVGIHAVAGNEGVGCIGLRKQDASDVHTILSVGSRIVIRR